MTLQGRCYSVVPETLRLLSKDHWQTREKRNGSLHGSLGMRWDPGAQSRTRIGTCRGGGGGQAGEQEHRGSRKTWKSGGNQKGGGGGGGAESLRNRSWAKGKETLHE